MPYSKYSPKQKKLAAVAGNKKKITGADLGLLQNVRKRRRKPRSNGYINSTTENC